METYLMKYSLLNPPMTPLRGSEPTSRILDSVLGIEGRKDEARTRVDSETTRARRRGQSRKHRVSQGGDKANATRGGGNVNEDRVASPDHVARARARGGTMI